MANYGGGYPAREKPHSQPSRTFTWAFIGGLLWGQQPTIRRGAEAPNDLGRQHQPRPVPSEYGLGLRLVRFANL